MSRDSPFTRRSETRQSTRLARSKNREDRSKVGNALVAGFSQLVFLSSLDGWCCYWPRSMYSYVAVWAVLQSFVPARCERSAMAYLLMSITPAGMHCFIRVGIHACVRIHAQKTFRSLSNLVTFCPLTRAISSTIDIRSQLYRRAAPRWYKSELGRPLYATSFLERSKNLKGRLWTVTIDRHTNNRQISPLASRFPLRGGNTAKDGVLVCLLSFTDNENTAYHQTPIVLFLSRTTEKWSHYRMDTISYRL